MRVCGRRLDREGHDAVDEPAVVPRGYGGEDGERGVDVVRPAEELRDALFDALVRFVLRHAQANKGEVGGAGRGWARGF